MSNRQLQPFSSSGIPTRSCALRQGARAKPPPDERYAFHALLTAVY
jgi:hypothetical protein